MCETRSRGAHRDLYPLPEGSGATVDVVRFSVSEGEFGPPYHAGRCLRRCFEWAACWEDLRGPAASSQCRAAVGSREHCLSLVAVGRTLGPIAGDSFGEQAAFQLMVDKGAGGSAMPLRADLVDSLPECSLVKSSGFLFQDELASLSGPQAFFTEGLGSTCPRLLSSLGGRAVSTLV